MSTPNWITSAGSLNTYPATIEITPYQLIATPVGVTYEIISGELPAGLSFRIDGLISGTPDIVTQEVTSTFVVRATEPISGDIADRTFSITISGTAIPSFTTPSGSLGTTYDSVWQEIPIEYNNPIPTNPVYIRVIQGALPPGLEINEYGLIRGYPTPPVILRNLTATNTRVLSTNSSNNYVTVLSTYNMYLGRIIIFTGTAIGGIVIGQTYYVKNVISQTELQISEVPGGDIFSVTTDSSVDTYASLPASTTGEPTKRQYTFTLQLLSPLGNATRSYSITVKNHYLPTSQGGPNPVNPPDSRVPTIYNTQPPTYAIENDTDNYGYYVLPPDSEVAVPGMTYLPTEQAYIGQFINGDSLAFKVLGHDFDNNSIRYSFSGLPGFLVGDTTTGWIYGTPTSVPLNYIQAFNFSVYVYKLADPSIQSETFNYSFNVANNINGTITWLTDSNLGTINNATNCYKYVEATSDSSLLYEIIDGELPPNLTLVNNGQIQGIVAYQPIDSYQEKDNTETFTFTIRAYNPNVPLVTSEKTFTLTVNQYYDLPTDSLYIKCAPSIADRNILRTLLDDETLIPTEYLYRPTDPNFSKATSVIYAHAYGVYSSTLAQYIEAVKKNHYWRNITLGQLKTAVAKDENGDVIYEVVYSDIIDNLEKYDPNYNYDYRYSTSISEEIYWPRIIDLNLGPWYTSITDIYTSYIGNQNAYLTTNVRSYDVEIQTGPHIETQQAIPTFYTSLTPGYARVLYPNSLENMRKRVSQELGADYNYRILPLWMTSQQSDGNTLGFTPAWVICYTKPGYAETIKNNIENSWPYTLNTINFQIDRFTVNKQTTYNYDSQLDPGAWTRYPSNPSTPYPDPDPIDSENFYVLFPQKTILPTKTQYDL